MLFSFYCLIEDTQWVYKNVKSFLSHKPYMVALISVSLALSQTPSYTARPRIWG